MPADVSPYAIFGWPRGGVVMTPNTAANHTPSLGSDAPSYKIRHAIFGHTRASAILFVWSRDPSWANQGCPGWLHVTTPR